MLKKIVKASIVLLLVGTLFFLLPPHFSSVHADNPSNTTFQVNVQEVLSVAITTPANWAKGNIDTFLRNKVTLAVTSNHIDGFTASMISSDTDAELHHSSKANTVIPTFSDNESHTCTNNTTCPEFPENKWGFAISDDINADVYNQVPKASGSPTTLISNAESTGQGGQTPITSRDIYFGAKSTIAKASGTYSGTVVFYVVSGIIDNSTNPNPPVNPTTDGTNEPTYANGQTVYTATTNNYSNNEIVSTTTTTTINEGDATSAYQDPAGVTDSTSSNIYDGSMLATGLAVTASVAAASGLTFFILAKRKKDDDEDEEETV